MRIASKFDGTCTLCGRSWSTGDEIEYRKNCASICSSCASAGHVPPPKEGAPSQNRGSAAPGAAPADGAQGAVTEAVRKIEKAISEIREDIRALRLRSGLEPDPAAEPARETEVGF